MRTSIRSNRLNRPLIFKIADTLLDLANIVAHIIDRAANVVQIFQNDIVQFGHVTRLSQPSSAGNVGRPHFTATMKSRGNRNNTLPSCCGG